MIFGLMEIYQKKKPVPKKKKKEANK